MLNHTTNQDQDTTISTQSHLLQAGWRFPCLATFRSFYLRSVTPLGFTQKLEPNGIGGRWLWTALIPNYIHTHGPYTHRHPRL
jgi:hypothetical protein